MDCVVLKVKTNEENEKEGIPKMKTKKKYRNDPRISLPFLRFPSGNKRVLVAQLEGYFNRVKDGMKMKQTTIAREIQRN